MNTGCYVRTRNKTFMPSQIAKIVSMKKDEGYNNQYFIKLDYNLLHDFEYFIYEEDVLKSSPNIIYLIEKNDYVNGYKVRAVYLDGNTPYIKLEPKDKEGTRIYEKDIKSIVTHEQFKRMQYNLESEVNCL